MSEKSEEAEVKTAENLKDIETTENQIMTEVLEQIMTKVLKEVESAEDSEQKTEEVEAEDLMAEKLKDEAEDEVKTKTEESSEQSIVKPQTGSRYGDSSYGDRTSNNGVSSSFSRISFGGNRFSNPGFSRNFASGPNFGRNRFGSGNGRSSFHHQPFGLSS